MRRLVLEEKTPTLNLVPHSQHEEQQVLLMLHRIKALSCYTTHSRPVPLNKLHSSHNPLLFRSDKHHLPRHPLRRDNLGSLHPLHLGSLHPLQLDRTYMPVRMTKESEEHWRSLPRRALYRTSLIRPNNISRVKMNSGPLSQIKCTRLVLPWSATQMC